MNKKNNLRIMVMAIMSFISVNCFSQTWVNSYYKKDGTHVQGYYRSNSNNTNTDNWSTVNNTNPYTGTQGSVAKDYSIDSYNYGYGQTIQTGPQGGQYYINDNGNKTYVPKRDNTNSFNSIFNDNVFEKSKTNNTTKSTMHFGL